MASYKWRCVNFFIRYSSQFGHLCFLIIWISVKWNDQPTNRSFKSPLQLIMKWNWEIKHSLACGVNIPMCVAKWTPVECVRMRALSQVRHCLRANKQRYPHIFSKRLWKAIALLVVEAIVSWRRKSNKEWFNTNKELKMKNLSVCMYVVYA